MAIFVDLSGQRFHRLTVLRWFGRSKRGHQTIWECLCDCGKKTKVSGGNLRNDHVRSCGCLRGQKRLIDLSGERFGKLTVLRRVPRESQLSNIQWVCRCDCGKETVVFGCNLGRGHVKSCGCLRTAELWARKKHGAGGYKNPLFRLWTSIKSRCLNHKNVQFKDYGGRGISVAPEWLGAEGFEKFVAHMETLGPKPSKEHSLDRINNDGNYEPGNVRWADRKTQQLNRRPSKRIELFSDFELLTECRRRNVAPDLLEFHARYV